MAITTTVWASALVIAAVLALPACGKSKSDQCSSVIAAYNDVGEAMRKGFGDGTDPAAIEANANAIDAATKAFVAIDVTDKPLKTARDDLAKVFTDHTTIMKSMAGSVRESNDPAKADAAAKKITAAVTAFEGIKTSMVTTKQALMTVCNATAK